MVLPSYFATQFKYAKNRTIYLNKKKDDTEGSKSLIL